jgi:hypothetical protein
MTEREVYLGDGVFASWDNWQIRARRGKTAIMRFFSSRA